MTQIKVWIVGLGAQAQNHLSVLSRDNKVVAAGVADIVEPIAQSVAKRCDCDSYRVCKEPIDSEKLEPIYSSLPL